MTVSYSSSGVFLCLFVLDTKLVRLLDVRIFVILFSDEVEDCASSRTSLIAIVILMLRSY